MILWATEENGTDVEVLSAWEAVEALDPQRTCPSWVKWYGENYTTEALLVWSRRPRPPDLCDTKFVRSMVFIHEGLGSSVMQKVVYLSKAVRQNLTRIHSEVVATHISDARVRHQLVDRMFRFSHFEICHDILYRHCPALQPPPGWPSGKSCPPPPRPSTSPGGKELRARYPKRFEKCNELVAETKTTRVNC